MRPWGRAFSCLSWSSMCSPILTLSFPCRTLPVPTTAFRCHLDSCCWRLGIPGHGIFIIEAINHIARDFQLEASLSAERRSLDDAAGRFTLEKNRRILTKHFYLTSSIVRSSGYTVYYVRCDTSKKYIVTRKVLVWCGGLMTTLPSLISPTCRVVIGL